MKTSPYRNLATLGEICDEIYRYPTYYGIEYSEDGIPEIRGELLQSDGSINPSRQSWRFIAPEIAAKFPKTKMEEGDLVLSVRGTIGKVGIVPWNLAGANMTANLLRISPNRKKIWPRYLLRFMLSKQFQRSLSEHSTSTTINTIRVPELRSIPVPIPPLAEQKDIVAILDEADALRRKRREAITKLDTLLYSVFRDMFGDMFINSKNWKATSLEYLLTFLTSGSRGWAAHYAEEGALFLRIQNVGRGNLLLNDIAYVNAPDGAEAKRTKVQPGDVLLSITADLGRTGVVPADIGNAYINQHLAILRLKNINPAFLSASLASPFGQRQFQKLNRQGVKAGLNFDDIKSLKIFMPPLTLQNAFEKVSVQIAIHRQSLLETSLTTEKLFSTLQHQAFHSEPISHIATQMPTSPCLTLDF